MPPVIKDREPLTKVSNKTLELITRLAEIEAGTISIGSAAALEGLAAADFVQVEGDQSIVGAKTFDSNAQFNGDLSIGGALAGPFLGVVINAASYGLRENASAATNTAALNAAADAFRALADSVALNHPATLFVPPGEYAVAAGVGNVVWDLSGIRQSLRFHVEAVGAVLIPDATCAGKTIIDLIHSRGCTGHLPAINANIEASAPAVGVQVGRSESGISSGQNTLYDLNLKGFFTRANLVVHSAELSWFPNPTIFNYSQSASAYCVLIDGATTFEPITDRTTVGYEVVTAQPFNVCTFINGDFWRSGYSPTGGFSGAPASTGTPIFITPQSQYLTFRDCYIVSADAYGAIIELNDFGHQNLSFDNCHFETSGMLAQIKLVPAAGATTPRIEGFRYITGNTHASYATIDTDALPAGGVTIRNAEIRIGNYNVLPSAGLFSAPTKVRIYGGSVSLPTVTPWATPAVFDGSLITRLAVVRYSGGLAHGLPITLAQDTAVAVKLPENCANHFILAISTVNLGQAAALIWVTPSLNDSLILVQPGTAYEILDGTVLTGTTGTVSKVTLGVTAGVLYLENRIAGSRTFSLSFLANR